MMKLLAATTEKLIRETESQLLVLEDVLKEEDFEKRMKEYECNASLLREEKLASLENLQSITTEFSSLQ